MLVKKCLENGGFIKPLLVPTNSMIGPSLSNPTILVSKIGELLVNLRNLNYVLYHSESGIFEHSWGPLCYLHQENDQRLVTNNILCKLDENFDIKHNRIIDTTFLDENPMWEFVGLEDGRLAEWDDKLFLSGVRRDTTTNGVGRMELSEIVYKKDKAIEKSRLRIPAPGDDNSYCEKNWMPVLNKKYTYVKWTNSTEVVEVNPEDKTCKTIVLTEQKKLNTSDLRGGSQVIFLNNHYLAIVHEVDLYKSEAGRKNAIYTHRFVVWNKDFEIVEVSDSFSFMGAKIEFCCGMADYQDKLLVTFGFQDNAAYLLGIPKNFLGRILKTFDE
jgi:predicted GH43/DUF377 family glycosyl hydrolase